MSDKANMGSIASADNLDLRLKSLDEARWIASRYAPEVSRRRLVALYLFNRELERASAVSEPMIARIRLQWWHEALAAGFQGKSVRRHEILLEIDNAFRDERSIGEDLLKLVELWIKFVEGDDAQSLDRERMLASLACRCVAPNASAATIECVAAIAISSDRATQRKLCRELASEIWPAFAHVAATRSSGVVIQGLASRWRIFWAIARRTL